MAKIIWTKIDEAPALATYSLLPVVQKFCAKAGVEVCLSDISLAGRILATFPENLSESQRVGDELKNLGELVKKPEANIIKLPNISASIPQLKACIVELQNQGYMVPDYPEDPQSEEQLNIYNRYASCLGSAVNPVLREGNSDRRAAAAVKNYALKNPTKRVKLRPYDSSSGACVMHMEGGDFYSNEKSVIKSGDGQISIRLNGKVLKTVNVLDKEILDGTFMSVKSLRDFYKATIDAAREKDLIWSLHLKATMMKTSDPILFGHAVEVFYDEVFRNFAEDFQKIGVNSRLGLGDLYKKLESLPESKRDEIKASIESIYNLRPNIAMVDSDKGITNLHTPNDIIIDASMPVVVRDGGKMWNASGALQDCMAVIPDASYAYFHKAMVDDCVANGQYDCATMGNVANVGLMAQKAEEYGSHATTFELSEDGTVEVIDESGKVLLSHTVEKGDIWRLSRVRDIPVRDWVRLAVERARITGNPVIFWLDKNRAHDRNVISKVNEYLMEHDTDGLEILIRDVKSATELTNARVRDGKDTIAATGNVLRDHLTDMYPILELGTSAKMLSIVPLLGGGGLFETGAGGSAPKHVEQFLNEGHLRWDSLGEFLALAEALRMIGMKSPSEELSAITDALDVANERYLDEDKSPSRKCGEPDNKVSHFYLAMYWAEALVKSNQPSLAKYFEPIHKKMLENEELILQEILESEGQSKDIGGYFHPDDQKASAAMRPSTTWNSILDMV